LKFIYDENAQRLRKKFKLMKFLYGFLTICTLSMGLVFHCYASTPSEKKQVSEALTLKDALVAAYNQTYLTSAQHDVQGSAEGLSAAKRDWLPQASLQSSYTADFNSIRNSGSTNGSGQTHASKNGVLLKQNLFNGGKTTAGIRGGERGFDKAVASYYKQESAVLFAVVKSYSDLVLKKSIYKVRLANQKVLEEQTNMAKVTNELGANTLSDVAQTESELAEIRAATTLTNAEVKSAQANFEKFTGFSESFTLQEPSLPSNLPQSKEEAVQWAFQHNNELKAAEAEADQYKESVQQVRADLLPSLDVSAGASRNFTTNWGTGFAKQAANQFEAIATLSVPLDFRGSTQAGVRKQKYDAAKKRIDTINLRRGLIEAIVSKWELMEAKQKNISQTEEQVKAAKVAYESMKEEFAAGMKTTLHLLSMEQKYFAAQIKLLTAQQEHLQATYDLLKEIGILSAQSLDLPVKPFDGEGYKRNVPIWGTGIEE